MANANNPFGLRPLTSMTGATGNFENIYIPIAYNDTTKIFTGDPVRRLNTGYGAQWTAASDVGNLAGIFVGVHYLSTSQGTIQWSQYWPGADVAITAQPTLYATLLPVAGAGAPMFYAQTDSTGAAFADIGQNVDVALGTGSTINGGLSGCYVDMSTKNTTATLPFRIVGLYGSPKMGAFGAGSPFGGIFPGAQVAGVAQPYSGNWATDPGTGGPGTAIAYNWVVLQANTSSTGTGI